MLSVAGAEARSVDSVDAGADFVFVGGVAMAPRFMNTKKMFQVEIYGSVRLQ